MGEASKSYCIKSCATTMQRVDIAQCVADAQDGGNRHRVLQHILEGVAGFSAQAEVR